MSPDKTEQEKRLPIDTTEQQRVSEQKERRITRVVNETKEKEGEFIGLCRTSALREHR